MPLSNMNIDSLSLINDLPGGFFLYEAEGEEKLIYANTAAIQIFGCGTLEEFRDYVGNSFRGMVHPDDLERVEQEIWDQIHSNSSNLDSVVYRIIRRDGQVRWIDDFGHLVHNEKFGDMFYVFISDITERRQQELNAARQLQRQERETDPLTGLYTKEAFCAHASEVLKEHPEGNFCILASDIENFRYINEAYGTERGNSILRDIADYRRCDIPGFILGGRIEGDRFAYLFDQNALSKEMLHAHMRSVCRKYALSHLPIKYGLYRVAEVISVSAMCNRALLALDSIKGIYGKDFAVYNDNLRMEWLVHQQINANAEESLRDRRFMVYYQPKHSLQMRSTVGAEALVRWGHPDFGFMNPGVFIPIFEKNGFITRLDLYVLDEVCRTLSSWIANGQRVVPISINLSRRDLDNSGLAEKLIEIVDSYGIPHDLIHFEITESCYSENPEQTSACVQTLHMAGFTIELDDFGAGYSSLVALRKLPIDILKIDRSILQQDEQDPQHNVQEFVMQLAGIMNMKTVQEGVETDEQLARLRELKCDDVQGFLFSKPIPKAEFQRYLQEHQ